MGLSNCGRGFGFDSYWGHMYQVSLEIFDQMEVELILMR